MTTKAIKSKISLLLSALSLSIALLCASNSSAATTSPAPTRKSASLSFSWNDQVGMAAFQRNQYFWIVFDQRQPIDTNNLNLLAKGLAKNIVQLPHSKSLVLRMELEPDTKVFVRKEGLLWVADLLTQEIPDKTKETQLLIQSDNNDRSFIFIPSATARNFVSVIDPEVGDIIVVILDTERSTHLQKPYKYPDLDFLSSAQGIAAIPNATDILFGKTNNGISIKGSERSLHISSNLEVLKRKEIISKTAEHISSLTTEIPVELLKRNFNDVVSELRQNIKDAGNENRNTARLALAQYYIGMSMGTEALTLLKQIEKEKDPISTIERFHGLKGVANFLAHRYPEAVEEFSFGELPSVNEAVFWRTLINSSLSFQKEDSIIINSFIGVIKGYPERIKEKIAVLGAENAIKAYDDMAAQNFIDILKSSQATPYTQAIIDYFTAEKLAIQGFPLAAVKEYRKAATSNNLKYSSLSRKKALEIEYSMNLVSLDTVISEFERVKYAWGENSFKVDTLERLSALYLKNKDPYNALLSLQLALDLSDEQQKEELTGKMVSIFEDLYIRNMEDSLPALKSLALYDDFNWLAPKSVYYHDIVQKLADRLVAVDLLSRAKQTLKELLDRDDLDNETIGKTGARLALVCLFRGDDDEAIEVLNDTEQDNLSNITTAQRRIIRAKALSNQHKDREALDLLKNDYSRNAQLIKTDLYWKAGLWDEASNSIKYLINPPVEGQPLSEEQIKLILDWVTTLKKAGKETVIVRLKNKFDPFFKGTKYQSVFNVMTSYLDKDKVDINDISQTVEDVKTFSNFTKIYNEALINAAK